MSETITERVWQRIKELDESIPGQDTLKTFSITAVCEIVEEELGGLDVRITIIEQRLGLRVD